MSIDRSVAPDIKPITQISLPHVEAIKWKNGITGFKINSGNLDLIEIEFLFKGGVKHEQIHSQSRMMSAMLKEGTTQFSQQQINETIDFYGAQIQVHTTIDFTSVKLVCLLRHLSNLLPLLKEILTNCTFPEKEMQTVVMNKKQKLILEMQKVEHLAHQKFSKLIFGKDYAAGHETKEDDFDNLKPTDLKKFYNQFIHAGNCLVIMAGKVTDNTCQLIEKIFGENDWKKDPVVYSVPVIESLSENKIWIEKKDAVQSAIRMGCLSINKSHPHWTAMKVLDTIYGGYFGSRLMSNLREEKGYCYGIYSSVVSMQDCGYLVIGTEVGSDVTKEAVIQIISEMNRLQSEMVSEEELQLVKNYMLGSILGNIDGVLNAASVVRGLMLYNLPIDSFNTTVEKINNVSSSDVLNMAQLYFNANEMKQSVAGSVNFITD